MPMSWSLPRNGIVMVAVIITKLRLAVTRHVPQVGGIRIIDSRLCEIA
jgi:hypothetical protein